MFEKRYSAASMLGTILFAAMCTLCVIAPTPLARAGLVDFRIDFGDGFATTPPNWNMMDRTFMSTVTPAGSEQSLYDFNNPAAPTDVSVKVTQAFFASGATEAGTINWANSKADWVDVNALRDWTMRLDNTPGQFALIGLDENQRYNIELLAARSNTSTAKYRVNDSIGNAVFPPGSTHTSSTETWSSDTDGRTHSGFMAWYDVATDSSGNIVIDVTRNGGNQYAFLMGMRLTTAPTTITHGDTSVPMHFSPVGNPGNAADTNTDANRNGYGAVPYRYKMGTHEVSVDQWNSVADPAAAAITIGVGSPRFSGDQPITEVSWYAAAQYCNWLTSGDKDKGVYTFQYNEAGTEITGVTTNRPLATYRYGKVYALPNENEWYKAAYYDPDKDGTGGYWNYGTQQDTAPTPLADGGGMAGAVYDRWSGGTYPGLNDPESVLLAGGASHYGTVGQSGNAFEWVEDYYSGTSGDRIRRGGSFANGSGLQAATWRGSRPPTSNDIPYNLGFRVAELSLLRDVRIDFGSAFKDGQGNPVVPEGWNFVATPGTSIPLQDFNDFTGDPVASIRFTGFAVSGVVQSPAWSNSEAPWVDDNGTVALNDYILAYPPNNRTGQITLSGLDPEAFYNVELLSPRSTTSAAEFTVNGLAGEAVFLPGSSHTGSTTAWNSYTDGLTNQGFMRWLSVAPNSDGTIVIDADSNGTYAFLMGMRISLVPEPGTSLLLLLGVLVGLLWRRNHVPD